MKPFNTLAWVSSYLIGTVEAIFFGNWTEGTFFLVTAIFMYQLRTD